jgi:CDGSH-type Zn-finger protein
MWQVIVSSVVSAVVSAAIWWPYCNRRYQKGYCDGTHTATRVINAFMHAKAAGLIDGPTQIERSN